MNERNLIIGFDLCNDYSQLCCYNYKTCEPESISWSKEQPKYLIPTLLGVSSDTKEWLIGDEAIMCDKAGAGVLIDNLLVRAQNNQETEILGMRVKPVTLLEKYINKSLLLIKQYYPNNEILMIVITMKELSKHLVEAVRSSLENLGIKQDRAIIQSHGQSYQYYTLSQNKELWINDVGLFDFDEQGLKFYQLTINKKVNPSVVGITEKDYTNTLSYDMIEEFSDSDNLEYIFESIAISVLHKQIISTIFITGKGFEGNWVDKVLKQLCTGRRVFKGQNLYAKGACYTAKEHTELKKLNGFLILSPEMVSHTISILGYLGGQSEVILVKADTPWYLVHETLDVIPDDTNEIAFIVKDILNREKLKFFVTLDELMDRPNKMTRIEIDIIFIDRITAKITLKDKGFGDIYPSTGKVWEKVISIQ